MNYKTIVEEIKHLPWHTYDPKKIIYLSWVTALEFAESLRCTLEAYPENKNLQELAFGELKTDNLSYGDYSKTGDHAEFLTYFLEQQGIRESVSEMLSFSLPERYLLAVTRLGDNKARAMTIFSREQELPDIFKSILEAHDWDALGLGFYKYYLERHIQLDSDEEAGHAKLIEDFELDEAILEKFYLMRLGLYRALEN